MKASETQSSHLHESSEAAQRSKRVSHQGFNDRGEDRSNNPPSKSHEESRENPKYPPSKSHQESNEIYEAKPSNPASTSHQESRAKYEAKPSNPPSKSHQVSREKYEAKPSNLPSKSHQESRAKYEAKTSNPPSKSNQESREKYEAKPSHPPSRSHRESRTTEDARTSHPSSESHQQNFNKSNEASMDLIWDSDEDVMSRADGDGNDGVMGGDGSEEGQSFSHAELKVFFQEAVGRLIRSDPLLSDLHPHVTPEEVSALIELENGQAMRVFVSRGGDDGDDGGGGRWEVVIPCTATVRQFKNALRQQVARVMSRQGQKKKISWKYVWRNNWLSLEGERLKNDEAKLVNYGVRNKSTLCFVKRYREKHSIGDNS